MGDAPKKCGLTELLVFIAAIVSGTICSIMSKNMMSLKGEGMTGEIETFEKPIFQTFGMFLGMLFGLIMHFIVLWLKLPFPGYCHDTTTTAVTTTTSSSEPEQGRGQPATEKSGLLQDSKQHVDDVPLKVPTWMYFFLAIPALFDLAATALCMMGLRYIDVSIYQLLRGSGIIFVAIMKQYVLGDKLHTFQWVGVIWNVVSVFMVGSVAILAEGGNSGEESLDSGVNDDTKSSALPGVLLVMLGAFVQSLQFVFEEKVLTMDIPAPPLLLIGMEGFWGTFFCLVVVYPLVYYLPGDDHGSYEDPFNTWYMIMNSTSIQIAFIIYFCAIFFYNFFAVLVTFLLNSVWHAILDNFRPITVWVTDLVIFYCFTRELGEEWTAWSWIQVGGMAVLLYGTAIYNAPNTGSISLEGQWYALGLNFSKEYKVIREEEEERMMDDEFQSRMLSTRNMSSFRGEIAASLR